MSGATLFSRPKKPEGPLEKRLALEDNRPIVRSVGTGQVIGAWIIAWAFTIQFGIPEILVEVPPPPDSTPPEITADFTPRDRTGKPVKRRPHENHGPKAQSNHPTKEAGRIKVEEIAANTGKPGKTGFQMIHDAIKSFDIDKLAQAATLTKTDPTRLSGRPGIKSSGFNLPSSLGDGRTTEIDLSPPSDLGTIATQGPKGGALTTSTTIEISNEGRFRSSETILKVVRSHTPGLRHLYNTFLKATPGMGGKVTVRFAVSPNGLVVDAAVDRGTTGNSEFEERVLAQIRSWRFEPIKATGNDIVTVPFNFSE